MSVVYTIGYEGTDIGRLVATLKAIGVERLADVRAIAHSRKKGFSKTALAARLAEEGIEYRHFSALGDPKAGREAARAGLYHKFYAIYTEHLQSEDAQASLAKLAAIAGREPTCLLCFERDAEACHRSLVAAELTRTSGFDVVDLYGDAPDRYVDHAPRLPRRHPSEGTAAA